MEDQRANVTVIVESVHPDASELIALFSALSTLSLHRCFTATHSRR